MTQATTPATPAAVTSSMVRGWPSLLITLIVFGAAVYSFSPRHAPPFEPTQIFPDKVILNGLAHQGSRWIAAGENGVILTADNPAGPWTEAKVEPTRGSALNAALALDGVLLAVGHDSWILRSEDQGKTWKEMMFDGEKSLPLLGISGPFGGKVFALGAFGQFLVSSDMGKTWTPQVHDALGDHHLSAMTQAADGSLLLVGERGLMAKSTDNGDTWTLLPEIYPGSFFGVLPLPSPPVPSGAQGARIEGALLVYGMRGNAFVSRDNGTTWTKSETPNLNSLFGGTVLDSGEIVLVGASNTVLLSKDDGATFTQVSERDRFALTVAMPLPGGKVLAAGEGGVLTLSVAK